MTLSSRMRLCPRFAEFFELMSTSSLSKNSVIPQASSTRSWISSFFDFIWDQVGLFRLPNVSISQYGAPIKKNNKTENTLGSAPSVDYSMLRLIHVSCTVRVVCTILCVSSAPFFLFFYFAPPLTWCNTPCIARATLGLSCVVVSQNFVGRFYIFHFVAAHPCS